MATFLGIMLAIAFLSTLVFVILKTITARSKSSGKKTPGEESGKEKKEDKKKEEKSIGWGWLKALAVFVLIVAAILVIRHFWPSWTSVPPSTVASVSRPITPIPDIGDTEEAALAAICDHESGGCHQLDKDGNVMQGKVDKDDTGAFQINKRIWKDHLEAYKIDINTEGGNRLFAELLYAEYGAWPWLGSMTYWGPKVAGKKFEMLIPVKPGSWTEVPILPGYSYLNAPSTRKPSGDYEVVNDAGERQEVRSGTTLGAFRKYTSLIRLKSLEKKDVWVRVTFFPFQS